MATQSIRALTTISKDTKQHGTTEHIDPGRTIIMAPKN